MPSPFRVKICGITQPDQGVAIANLGATALGFICVRQSPRYVTPEQIRAVVDALGDSPIDRIGVFVNAGLAEISQVVAIAHLTAIQLHGDEPPQLCQELRQALPGVELIKAIRVRCLDTLNQATTYRDVVDTLLLDAYHPHLFGGTGARLDWATLQTWRSPRPWFLAGGITPDNVQQALTILRPDGIDLSSGLERAPGDKDLDKVAALFANLRARGN
jgi:phosphoribosylanthranilate isomerase